MRTMSPGRGPTKRVVEMHVPFRTCIVCGAKRPKNELLRLALGPDMLVRIDQDWSMGGRGGYVCNNEHCLGRLTRHRKLGRVFRSGSGVDLHPSLKEKRFNTFGGVDG